MTDESNENAEKPETTTTPETPAAQPDATPAVVGGSADASEPVAESLASEQAGEPHVAEAPPLGPAPGPVGRESAAGESLTAEEPVAADVQEEPVAEAPAPAADQPPAEATPADALPPHESVAEPADSGAESAPAADEVPAESAPEPEQTEESKPAPKKPRKVAKTAAVAAEESAPATDEAAAEESAAVAESAETGTAGVEAEGVVTGEPAPENKKRWYAVKIQSGREESIKAAIERKVKIEGLEEYFGQIVIPVEEVIVKKKVKVKNKKTGETTTQEKNVTKYNKKFPGYLFAEVEFNNEILYVFRETSGVGDFVGVNTKKTQGAVERQPPTPMTESEVQSMLTGIPDKTKPRGGKGKVVVKLDVEKGDKVRIRNGAFVGSEGEVKAITEPKDPTETPKVTVVVTLWGRPVEVELDYWEVDKV